MLDMNIIYIFDIIGAELCKSKKKKHRCTWLVTFDNKAIRLFVRRYSTSKKL